MNASLRWLIPAVLLASACATAPNAITRHDRPDAQILRGVDIPAGYDLFFTSGLVAKVKNPDAAPETYQRYGDAKEQCLSTMKQIEETLALSGYTLDDVVQLRIYLAPDKDGKIPWQAWFDTYPLFFANSQRPQKVARTTLAVHSLARPDILVEIEAVAARKPR